ncbi:hypothetical protein B0H19DRAFT_1103401 [Mycena capillaripes]|nr:hypothetical protein B0H19DRAFT_1103401 [Mycena capillaripes]
MKWTRIITRTHQIAAQNAVRLQKNVTYARISQWGMTVGRAPQRSLGDALTGGACPVHAINHGRDLVLAPRKRDFEHRDRASVGSGRVKTWFQGSPAVRMRQGDE